MRHAAIGRIIPVRNEGVQWPLIVASATQRFCAGPGLAVQHHDLPTYDPRQRYGSYFAAAA